MSQGDYDALNTIVTLGQRVISALLKPSIFVHDPSKRIFWGYILASLLIAAIILIVRERRSWLRQLYEQLLSPQIWLHPSSFLDMKMMIAKSLIRIMLFIPWLMSSYKVAISVVQLLNSQIGPATQSTLNNSIITAIYTTVLFVCSDFSRYLLHRFCHENPLLWQFHQVHHSAEVMTPLTLYRSHPIENLLFMMRGVAVTGIVTGVFFYFFGARAVQYQFLGVNFFGLLFNFLGANLRHSHVWISYGSIVERVFLSPAQHQLHHSAHPKDHGANYGSCLAIWDWGGGSLRVASERQVSQFGLSPGESNHNPHALGSSLFGPFLAVWQLTLIHCCDLKKRMVKVVTRSSRCRSGQD